MKRRITRVAATAVVLAVLVLGVPLAVAIGRLVVEGEHGELERAALRAASAVSPDYLRGDQIELSSEAGDVAIAVYAPDGRRVAGSGPATAGPEVTAALRGSASRGTGDGSLVDVVPVQQGERTIGAVRAATPTGEVHRRTLLWWMAMAGAGLLAVAAAVTFASRQSRLLAQPLVDLADAARRLGDGDFSSRPGPSRVAEIEAVAVALARTAERLESLVERERAFAARASHQLRTPLTQLQVELERGLSSGDAGSGNEAALAIVEQLTTTVADILSSRARADTEAQPLDVGLLVDRVARDWRGPLAASGRPLRIRVQPTGRAATSVAAVRQALHVLLDNALTHGAGAVTVEVREAHGAVAVDVADEGSPPPDLREGLGLSMARSLVEREGGRIVLTPSRGTRFTMLLPQDELR